MNIILAGAKSSGKSTVGPLLQQSTGLNFVDIDDLILKKFASLGLNFVTCAEAYRKEGRDKFRQIESEIISEVANQSWQIVAPGGGALLNSQSRRILKPNSVWIYLSASSQTLWSRISQNQLPAYLENSKTPKQDFASRLNLLDEILDPLCDYKISVDTKSPDDIAQEIVACVAREFCIKSTSPSTLGNIIRTTTFGESHGAGLGAILDGVPAGLEISEEEIQTQLNRRKPGQSSVSTPRKESDKVKILSGLFEGKTTGAPIGLLIENSNQRSKDYESLKEIFRPGHADFTFWKKFGIRDYKGGGRSSGRETVSRVAAGAVARKFLEQKGISFFAHCIEIVNIKAHKKDFEEIEKNPVRCADSAAAIIMEEKIRDAQQAGNSVGGIVQLEILGVPAGLGDPVFAKLDAKLAAALFSIGAVKGVEIGAGFSSAKMTGSQFNDQMTSKGFETNNAGGIAGGISTGQNIQMQIAVKPTPSISLPQITVDTLNRQQQIEVTGRHDPCIVPRIIPVIEQVAALVIMDCWLIQKKLKPDFDSN